MKQQLNIKELVWLLDRCEDQHAEVRFDFCGFVPAGTDSYRGDYSHLAIKPLPRDELKDEARFTVAKLSKALSESVGKTVEGYKGGSYVWREQTPVWVAKWGDCWGTAVVGVLDDGNTVYLETTHIP